MLLKSKLWRRITIEGVLEAWYQSTEMSAPSFELSLATDHDDLRPSSRTASPRTPAKIGKIIY